MKRLCFLSPDVEETRKAVAALRRAGVDDAHLMVIARSGIPLEELPGGTLAASDAIPGLVRGLTAGGVMGAVAGVVALSIEEVGLILGAAAIPLFATFGAAVSGLASVLVGASFLSSRLSRFRHAIDDERKILLMVDVADERIGEIEALVKVECPRIEFAGLEPHTPIIPR